MSCSIQRMWTFLCVIILSTTVIVDAFLGVHISCGYGSWKAWTPCTRSCGGGTRQRVKWNRCNSNGHWQTGGCNQFCYNGGSFIGGKCQCPPWRSGSCCSLCKHVTMPNCKPGQQECGGSIDNIKCKQCDDPYYPAGYGNGCALCPRISNCEHRHCTRPGDTMCLSCYDDRSFFMRTHSDTRCERMCAWNNHYCWPGECPTALTSSCKCTKGFHAVRTALETSCQLDKTNTPNIETCETKIVGPNGEMKRAESTTSLTNCDSLTDFYGNFQPRRLIFDIMTEFTIHIGNISKPKFINNESNLGITDMTLSINIQPVTAESPPDQLYFVRSISQKTFKGSYRRLKLYTLLEDTSSSIKASRTFPVNQNMTLLPLQPALETGEMLCIIYEAKGGGFLKSVDLRQATLVPSAPVPYTKTSATKRLCYIYDSSSPEHCAENGSCSFNPIQVSARITRTDEISVEIRGWTDPIPAGGNSTHASGIESYEITLHEVTASKNVLKVSLGKLYNITVKMPRGPLTLNLSSENPKLYAIYLEVKDNADNTKHSRGFVLYDKTSKIESRQDKPFFVESASQLTNHSWQTHHNDVCLNWTSHFYNRIYKDNPFLNPIESDPSGLIKGEYDQMTGILPISGTPNVNGILQYKFSWTLNDGHMSSEIDVQQFLRQHYCHSFQLNDGETYTLNIRAIDVVNNTFAENRKVHIDRSVPHINNIWLVKDGVYRLFVHDRTDLSNMKLYFEAIDPHSGIREIHWLFGSTDSGSELLTGSIAVNTIDTDCPSNSSETHKCYCPDVGKCELYQYALPMNKLVNVGKHIGDHNRNYYFTIKAVNHALLANIEHLDILVDDSPPEKGVIFEGPVGSPDFDYTSDDSTIVHWHGFIDHESGINSYYIALSDNCLTKQHMSNSTFHNKLQIYMKIASAESSVRLPTTFTGKMFTTIVAVNNALGMSEPACSDGITRDISAPQISNITLYNARWTDSLSCLQGRAWLLNSDMKKIQLQNTTACINRCSNFTYTDQFPAALQTIFMDRLEEEMSDFLCTQLPTYEQQIIYLPDDHIYLRWDVKDVGSQTNDYVVGIGLDRSEVSDPSQLKYTSTEKNNVFNKHHTGIGSSELFFIFLKVENKAGLTRVSTVGPLLIDQTPPLSRSVPDVKVDSSNVIVTWDNTTFYDMEQSEPIDTIYFKFALNSMAVTATMEWRQDPSSNCSGHRGFCIEYPVERLQQHDTEFGSDFHITLFVYNKAGHFLKVDTEKFRLPSRYPPGHAHVWDTDPRDTKYASDVDIHFSSATLCAKWSAFRHQESSTLEFAVGSNVQTDDVFPFQAIKNVPSTCINSSKLLPGVKYHALLRATGSGGKTVSASNGVMILTQSYVDKFFKVHVGENCQSLPEAKMTVQNNQNGDTILNLTKPLEIGQSYNIYTPENTTVEMVMGSGSLSIVQSKYFGNYYNFVPFVHHPMLTVLSANNSIETRRIKITRCPSKRYVSISEHFVGSFWYLTSGIHFPATFEAGIVKEDINATRLINAVTVSSHHTRARIQIPHDASSWSPYRMAVRTCVHTHCLAPVLSENFTLLFNVLDGHISVTKVDYEEGNKCLRVNLQWDAFTSDSPVMFYQWTLTEDNGGIIPVTQWTTIENAQRLQYQVNECLDVPRDLFKTLFACVRAYTEGEESITKCKEVKQTLSKYRRNVVYDIDSSGKKWTDIKPAITSSNLGDLYKLLLDSEFDFGNTSAKIAGVVVFGTEQDIEWFLMARPEIPTQCQDSHRCLQYRVSRTGIVEFDTRYIAANTLYYICARSNVTYIEREIFTERLDGIRTCSDGFVLNDTPPSPGVVHVSEQGGYLTDITHIQVSWDGFRDNSDATKLGYVNSIRSYSLAVGSGPNGDDIAEFSDVGLSNVVVTNITGESDGAIVYFTVKAVDQSGFSTMVTSRGLTVDTSPPRVGQLMLNYKVDAKYLTITKLNIHPVGFSDKESGVHQYEIAVGTSHHASDIVSSVTFTDAVDLDLPADVMSDGNVYYVILKATNRAGLESAMVTKPFIFDRSPPTGESILDGHSSFKKDENFQKDVHHIKSHWKEFDDIHSGIKSYSVGLGMRPYEDDVEAVIDVGLHTEITWNGSYVPGQMYYTVVEACNNAGLCTKKSSNGILLDNSPPIHGLVRVGSGKKHDTYIPRSSSVHLHWHGFEDPQSGIEHFEACIGTRVGECDIEPTFHCLLQSNILKTGLKLPAHKNLYATVIAFNNVGMNIKQSSDAFRVDESPPSIVHEPTFILDYTNIQGLTVQWEPSLLGIKWEFKDDESPIIDHTVTVKTHHEGHTPVEYVHIGNENSLNISLDAKNWLKSGDKYYVVVTSCNAARHCSSARSQVLLIDSTPPHLGGFRPPLTWKTRIDRNVSTVHLTWYGFHDPESDIKNYFLSVSRSYSGNELTNGEVVVVNNSTDDFQQTGIKLCEKLKRYDMLILSIMAQNNAGLNSSVARVSVYALSTSMKSDSNEGLLELEKHSCEAHYCNKDCTCAVIGKPCTISTSANKCKVLNVTDINQHNMPILNVYGGQQTYPQLITASSACLSGHWKLKNSHKTLSRFEWSMGLLHQPIGEGVFDLNNEIPWRDVGLRQEVVHCLTSNQSLLHGHEYVIYVRAWFSRDLNAIFNSKPIKIDQTPPEVGRGKYIKDSNPACKQEFEFIDWMDTITACWDNVFNEKQSHITHYFVSLGTSPKADDVFRRTNVGLKTQLTLTSLTLSHGTKYYFSVTAFNTLGLHTSLSSDGFVVDTDIPISGVVFNTDRHVNAAYQSSIDSFSLSWHGFIDHQSGIRHFYVGLTEESKSNQSQLVFRNVGLHNSFTLNNVRLEHGKKYVGLVKAVDAAGHESRIAVSPVKTVDVTPPEGYECLTLKKVRTCSTVCSKDGSYDMSTHVHLNRSISYRLTGFMTSVGTAVVTFENMRVSMPVTVAHDGSSHFEYTIPQHEDKEGLLKVSGACNANANITLRLSQCSNKTLSKESAVTVHQISLSELQIHSMVSDSESKIKKLLVGMGTTRGGFQIKALSEVYRTSNGVVRAPISHGSRIYTTLIAENYAGLRSVFNAKAITMDHTAPIFRTTPTVNITDATNATQSVRVIWNVADKESGVQKCFCGLGKQPTLADLYDYAISETTHSCRMDNISLKHGDAVYASVFCVNSVELSSEHSSRPVFVSEEPPTASSAVLTIVPSGYHSPKLALTNTVLAIQTNLTCLQLQWSGFLHVFDIERYEYRLKNGEKLITDWTDAGKETMATIDGVHLQSGLVYSAEVRAISVGNHSSDAVQADVLVLGQGPVLSGKTMQMTLSEMTMQLDWTGVFNLNRFANVSYILVTGTQDGYTDVIDNLHTTDTSFSFIIPGSTLVSPRITEIFIELTCAYATGMSTVYRTSYKLT